MNVASLELCKELYELSKDVWKGELACVWYVGHKSSRSDINLTINDREGGTVYYWSDFVEIFHYKEEDAERYEIYPAYDLGYLLRKLPVEIGVFDTFDYRGRLTVSPGENNWWYASYDYDKQTVKSAHSPEDAAAKLAIELFKDGVLTRGGDA